MAEYRWRGNQEDFDAMWAMVQANHDLLKALCTQLPAQHREHMDAMRELTEISKAQLAISQEYKKFVGDPLRRGSQAMAIIRAAISWIAGILLTVWGLKEIFDTYFVPRIKP